MRYSVCLDIFYFGQGMARFLEGMRTAKAAGYPAVEFWGWWNKDIPAIAEAAKALDLEIAALCTPFVSLGVPGRREEYLEGLKKTVEVAKRLGCPTIISQTGFMEPGLTRESFRESLVTGLREAGALLEGSGCTLAVEPLNVLVDHAGYYLYSSKEAFDILREVDRPRVKLLYDIYHQQITEGNLIPTIEEHIGDIAHFHGAGHPGRHELTGGEINYREVLRAIAALSYRGYVGLEYRPLLPPEESLTDARKVLI